MKRFYKSAGVVADGGIYRIALDGRILRTPARASLAFPNAALAAAVASEWDRQEEVILPRTMPFTSLASTAIDRVAPRRDAVVEEAARYAGTDLLCYRAPSPQELSDRQAREWQPLLDWAEIRYDARLDVTESVLPLPQPEGSLRALKSAVDAMDDFELACLHGATASGGSLIVALALLKGHVEADRAAELVQLDERHQAGIWGEDPETARGWELQAAEIAAARRFIDLLRG